MLSVKKEEEEMVMEKKEGHLVPVLSVSKNGTIIDTIVLNNPADSPQPEAHPPEEENAEIEEENEGKEQVLFAGRHPDCHIVLDHPSISRYHLQIQLQKSARCLVLTDLSSVHGTWIGGQRATPQLPVKIGENDTFRLGASSRLYKLQWLPVPLTIEEEEIHSVVTLSRMGTPGKETLICAFEDQNKALTLKEEGILEDEDGNKTPTSKEKGILEQEDEHKAITLTEDRILENEDKEATALKEEGTMEDFEPAPWFPVEPSAPPLPQSLILSPQQLAVLVGEETHVILMHENQSHMRKTAVGEAVSSLWSRRHKTVHLLHLQTSRMEGNCGAKNIKQNHMQLSNEKGKRECVLEELQPEPSVYGSSSSVSLPQNDESYPSDKENLTPQVPGQASKVNAQSCGKLSREVKLEMDLERVPFQPLSRNSKTNCRPHASSSSKNSTKRMENHRQLLSSEAHNFDLGLEQVKHLNLVESKKNWHMVVDTGCLIDKESRQSLKQLEGIKGTRMIIPRIVIRELDCLERRNTSKIVNEGSASLRWIEECMVKTGWWVHVQNSTESSSIGVTPPASPHSHPSDGSNASASVAFSSYGSFVDVLSPTAEDHILECALLFNRLATDARVVLLTNNIALKIKAMAEGMVCENAKEFCESLVSPYSERFLWTQSTPHGHNWTHFSHNGSNSAKLRMRRMKPSPPGDEELKRRSYEGAKGLKLILLHNSHYGQQRFVKH